MHKLTGAALGFCLAVITGLPVQAADDPAAIKGQVALGLGAMPDYEGASAYVMTPYLEGELHRGDFFARLQGADLEFNLFPDDSIHMGPLVGYRLGRGDVHNGAISRMAHIRYSVAPGLFAEYEHRADDPRSGERLTLTAEDGVLNTDTGWTVVLRGVVHRPVEFIDPGLIAAIEGDVGWADATYMQRFFGVNGSDALASGLPLYPAHAGFETAGVAFSLDQFLSRQWSVGTRLHYGRLLGHAADSPVVKAGSPDQFFAALVVGYVIGGS